MPLAPSTPLHSLTTLAGTCAISSCHLFQLSLSQKVSILHNPGSRGGERDGARTLNGLPIRHPEWSLPFDLSSWWIIRPDFSINPAFSSLGSSPANSASPMTHIDIPSPPSSLRSRGAAGPEWDHLVREASQERDPRKSLSSEGNGGLLWGSQER